jgi:HAD superfamily hydrolase (TIGR01509 family)
VIEAVVFDLDGVLVDSEGAWGEVRREYTLERGGRWPEDAQRAMMGMSSVEWSRYMQEVLGVNAPPERISREVAERVADLYRKRLPLISGAREAVERLASRWPLGLASSANRELIDLALDLGGLSAHFKVTVSSEEVTRGKPEPDVYLEAARRLSVAPESSAAIEDSHNGILAAAAASMRVIAIPNREFPPGADALERTDRVLPSLQQLTVESVEG